MNKFVNFSEKQIILSLLFLIFVLSTILIYLMLNKEILKKQNKQIMENNYSKQEITNTPKVEIEVSK